MHSSRQEKYKVIINFFSLPLLDCIHDTFYWIAHLTSCSLIQLLESRSREIRECPSGSPLGDASTGWASVFRIMIEDVSRAQS